MLSFPSYKCNVASLSVVVQIRYSYYIRYDMQSILSHYGCLLSIACMDYILTYMT